MTSQTLSAKDSTAFKSLLKLFELKMYKKGLKTAETLLKKHPEHGETLAMKGLFVSNLGKRDEAHMLVKQGLRFHLTSHICWHVYGLLHRSERNYDEAIKCYSHALKYDRENIHIIRDYSLLQMHMRNYSDYVTSRKLLLDLQPGNKFNWFGLAVALHLDQQYDAAIRIIDTFVSSMGSGESTICYEHGEVLLYRNMILEESGDLQGALDHLNLIKRNCVDVVSWKETRGTLY